MSQHKILVVEDESIVAMDLRQRLTAMGYEVTAIVSNGASAIEEVTACPPDLALLDIQIKGDIDGIETAKKIQERFDIPIVFLTANSDSATVARAKTTGPLAYLLKPFEDRDLRTTIEIALHRHQLEQKLKASESWLQTVLHSIGDAVIATDIDGRIVFMNPVAEDITGWTSRETELTNSDEVLNLVSEGSEQAVENPVRQCLRDGSLIGLANHTILINRFGKKIPIEDSAAPIHDDQGNLVGCVMVFRDVSERKKMERDLNNYRQYLEKLLGQKTEELEHTTKQLDEEIEENARIEEEKIVLRSLVENSPDSIGITSLNGRLIYLNKIGRQLIGVEETEISDNSIFKFLTKDQQKTFRDGIGRQIVEDGSWFGEITFFDKSENREIPAEVNAFLIYPNDENKPLCIGFIMRDITERKVSEKNQRVLQDQLQRAERMKAIGILAGGVAHDLNNMLGPLVGYPDLILRKIEDSNPLRKMIERMGKSANDAAGVIQDLLTLARRGKYDLVPLNLNQVIADYLNSIPFLRIKDENPGVELQCRFDKTIPNLEGSGIHLQKVLMNLIINAYEAMQESGGTVTLETSSGNLDRLKSGFDKIQAGKYVQFRIVDTGSGISPDDVKKIFEPYFSRKQMARSGSGLGLAIVYGIIKDHGGYYDVMSTVGEGTEFILYFPAILNSVEILNSDGKLVGGTEHILIVDDDQDQRALADDLLSSLGYKVSTVDNGHGALNYLRDNSVDIVVLDMIMEPNFDGLDTYREITKTHPNQKAIVVSGFSQTERVREMLALGAGAYIRKPYSLDQLAQALRKELDKAIIPELA